jgi:hypothetical protein
MRACVRASRSKSLTAARAATFAEYGDRCWETDILPAADIEAALDADIRSWLDGKLWSRRDREIERVRTLL